MLAASCESTGDLRLVAQAIGQFREVVSARVLAAAGRAGELGSLADALALLSGCTGDPAAREEALAIARVAVAAVRGWPEQAAVTAAAADRSRCPGTG